MGMVVYCVKHQIVNGNSTFLCCHVASIETDLVSLRVSRKRTPGEHLGSGPAIHLHRTRSLKSPLPPESVGGAVHYRPRGDYPASLSHTLLDAFSPDKDRWARCGDREYGSRTGVVFSSSLTHRGSLISWIGAHAVAKISRTGPPTHAKRVFFRVAAAGVFTSFFLRHHSQNTIPIVGNALFATDKQWSVVN